MRRKTFERDGARATGYYYLDCVALEENWYHCHFWCVYDGLGVDLAELDLTAEFYLALARLGGGE